MQLSVKITSGSNHTHTLVINSKFAFFSHKVWLGSDNSWFRATCCRSLRLLLNTLVGLRGCCSDCRRHRPRLSRLSCLRHHRCGQHRGCWRLNLFFLRWVRTLQSLFNELILWILVFFVCVFDWNLPFCWHLLIWVARLWYCMDDLGCRNWVVVYIDQVFVLLLNWRLLFVRWFFKFVFVLWDRVIIVIHIGGSLA